MVLNYDWPGNLRELHNSIERAVILCDGDTIEPVHLQCEIAKSKGGDSYLPSIHDLQGNSLKEFLERIEKHLVRQALIEANGNQVQAAKNLGEPRHIVRYLVKKHHLKG